MSIELSIQPQHRAEKLSEPLQHRGRLQVPNFLAEHSALELYQLLQEHSHWYLTYNEGQQNYESEESAFSALPTSQQQKFLNNIYSRARENFQYLFKQYYISQAVKLGENAGHPMHEIHDWVNSEEFLGFMRQLTKSPEATRSDSYASVYEPGHFLTMHENWGGYLTFYDEEGNVTEAFKPTFNTLNVFTIPQKHAVQLVAPFAGSLRTSYMGWLLR